jgi:hypothetical protein
MPDETQKAFNKKYRENRLKNNPGYKEKMARHAREKYREKKLLENKTVRKCVRKK